MTGPLLSRRSALGGAAALAGIAVAARAAAAPVPRIAALDWNLAATSLELGVSPVGVAEQALYRAWVETPALPSGATELGLRLLPSFETLEALRPDLILINALNEPLRARLDRIAPTFTDETYGAEREPLARSRPVTRNLAVRLGRADRADVLLADADRRLGAAREKLAPRAARPCVAVTLVDGRHMTVYGRGSLYADTMAALGLTQGFDGPTGPWGTALLTAADLGRLPAVDLVLPEPALPAARVAMAEDGLLHRMLVARGSRLVALPPVWPFGSIITAARFAEQLAAALTGTMTG